MVREEARVPLRRCGAQGVKRSGRAGPAERLAQPRGDGAEQAVLEVVEGAVGLEALTAEAAREKGLRYLMGGERSRPGPGASLHCRPHTCV